MPGFRKRFAPAFIGLILLSLVSNVAAGEYRIRIVLGASRANVGIVLPETENLPASVVGGSSGGSSGLLPEGDEALLDSLANDLGLSPGDINDLNFIDFENGTFAFEFDVETETPPTVDQIDNINTVPLTFTNSSGTFTRDVPVDDSEPPIVTDVPDSELSDTELAIIIIFSIIGFCFLVLMAYFCYKYKERDGDDKVAPYTEPEDPIDRPGDSMAIAMGSTSNSTINNNNVAKADEPKKDIVETTVSIGQAEEKELTEPTESITSTITQQITADSNGNAQLVVTEQVVITQNMEEEEGEEEEEPATEDPVEIESIQDSPDAASAKKKNSGIASKRASYNWNATANAVADSAPGGRVVPKLESVTENASKHPDAVAAGEPEPELHDSPAQHERSDIADEKAKYLYNATANAVADPDPDGHPVPKLAAVVEEATH